MAILPCKYKTSFNRVLNLSQCFQLKSNTEREKQAKKLYGRKLLHLICPSVFAFLVEQKGQPHFQETNNCGYRKGETEDQEYAALLLPPLQYWPCYASKPLPSVLDSQMQPC